MKTGARAGLERPQCPLSPQPPVPGMDEGMPYQAPPQQMPAAQPPQPANPPHGAHPLSSGPQPGTAPATQHSQAGPASGQAYGQHTYSEPAKPKKGQQLWNRMKRERLGVGSGGTGRGPHWWEACGRSDLTSAVGTAQAVGVAAREGGRIPELRCPAPRGGAS